MELKHFDRAGARGFYRPVGAVSLAGAIDLVTAALALACGQGVTELLVNLSALTGFGPPSVAERYDLISKWAGVAAGRLRLAVVVRPEMIDPQKFGVPVAANRGLASDVFSTEAEALVWLDGGREPVAGGGGDRR